MSKNIKLKNMKVSDFNRILARRRTVIDATLSTFPVTKYPVNMLAKQLHPTKQFLIIEKVVNLSNSAKKFTLIPNKELGTKKLAYFEAGQYLNIDLDIDGSLLSKPYSICSSPQDAHNGKYEITIKRTNDGFASDYILDNWKVGDKVTVSGPNGEFKYEPLRDAKKVIGIAGGSGITPFRSLARAIADGTEDFNLTIIYGSRSQNDILFKDEFDQLAKNCNKINIVHVLSNEKTEGFEHGFISKEIIKKYTGNGEYSLFICGPQIMYDFVDKEIEKLNIEQKYIRHELFGQPKNPESNDDYPQNVKDKEFKLTVIVRDKKIELTCNAKETLLIAMERGGIKAPSKCRSGECGFCRSRLISGTYYCPKKTDGRRLADEEYGFIHPCCSFPTSDIVINVPVVN